MIPRVIVIRKASAESANGAGESVGGLSPVAGVLGGRAP